MKELNRNENITIGTSSIIVSNDKTELTTERRNITIMNNSEGLQCITISIDKEAVCGAGIVLSPGGVWSDNAETGYKPTQKAIHVISTLASGIIALQERSLE